MDITEQGVCDMQGNVSEMCEDNYSSIYYLRSPIMNPKGSTKNIADNDSYVKKIKWYDLLYLPFVGLAFEDLEAEFAEFQKDGIEYYIKSLRGFNQYHPLTYRNYMVGYTQGQDDTMYVSENFGFRIVCEEE
jgi:hypothetical protein